MLGEHGDSQVAALHAASVAGIPLFLWLEQHGLPRQALAPLLEQTVYAGWHVLQGKGCTEFGIGGAAAALIRAILRDEKAVLPCSTRLQGQYGQQGVYASTPCRIGAQGVETILELPLSPQEQQALDQSCAILRKHLG